MYVYIYIYIIICIYIYNSDYCEILSTLCEKEFKCKQKFSNINSLLI